MLRHIRRQFRFVMNAELPELKKLVRYLFQETQSFMENTKLISCIAIEIFDYAKKPQLQAVSRRSRK